MQVQGRSIHRSIVEEEEITAAPGNESSNQLHYQSSVNQVSIKCQ
jgi:hypothetical protein